MTSTTTRAAVLAYRVRVQQLDRASGTVADTAVLDLGVQDTGTDGGGWPLACRGLDTGGLAQDELATVWSLRGAPHLYRRADLPAVAAAVQPFSEADAGKRIFDASKPLRAAGIGNLEALDTVAATMRDVVRRPTVKGDVSGALTDRLDPPYLRFCRPCDTTHVYEMPFRLAALRAGLELQPGTSPPVLARIPRFRRAGQVPARSDVVRGYLHLLGPATPRLVAGYLDAPVRDVTRHWPEDVVEVDVEGERRWALADDAALLRRPGRLAVTRLLAPFDLFLQARDRPLLVADPARAKALWPAIGRPGAVLHGGELAGTWRPRKTGRRLTVTVEPWVPVRPALRRAVTEQAERLAAHRGAELAGVAYGD